MTILSTGGTARCCAPTASRSPTSPTSPGFPRSWTAASRRCTRRFTAACSAGAASTTRSCASTASSRSTCSWSICIRSRRRSRSRTARSTDAIENIDIGGPAMVRAAAKNHDRVTVVVDPLDYGTVLAEMDRDDGTVSAETRLRLAAKAFTPHGAVRRDGGVVSRPRVPRHDNGGADFPDLLPLQFRKRHGPALRREPAPAGGVLRRERRAGREHRLAHRSCRARNSRSTTSPTPTPRSSACGSSTQPACVIVKHANPCGVAVAPDSATPTTARTAPIRRPRSAASSRSTARSMRRRRAAIVERQFVEVIVAPAVDAEAPRSLRAQGERAAARDRRRSAPTQQPRRAAQRQRRAARCRRAIAAWSTGARLAGRDTRARRRAASCDDLLFAWQRLQVRQVERDRVRAATARPSASAPAR